VVAPVVVTHLTVNFLCFQFWVAGSQFEALMLGGNTISNVGSEGFILSGNNVSVYIDRNSVADHAQNSKLSAYAYYSSPNDMQVTFSNHTMDSGKAYIWSIQMQYVDGVWIDI
jgi:hypothetical protein